MSKRAHAFLVIMPALLALALAAPCGFAQGSVRLAPRHVLLSVAAPPGSGFNAGDLLMIQRSLHQRLSEAEPDVIFVELAREPAGGPPATGDLNAAAQSAGADAWLQVTLSGDWSSAHLRVRAYDLLLRSTVADISAERNAWATPAGLSQDTWADVVQAVSGKFPMVEASSAESGRPPLARLTVAALPGSTITGLGSPPLRVGRDGAAFRELAPLKEYVLRVERPGYSPVEMRIYLASDRRVEVQQKKSATWGLEGSLSDSRAPGLDASVYFPASPLFLRGGFYTYALGLALDSSGVLLSLPLTNLEAQLGTYLSAEDRFFRFYFAAGGFVRLVHAPDTLPRVDSLSAAGLRLIAGVESPVSPHGKLYLELTPSWYQTSQPDALRASLGPDNNPPGWAFFPQGAFNVLSFRVGYRWRP